MKVNDENDSNESKMQHKLTRTRTMISKMQQLFKKRKIL